MSAKCCTYTHHLEVLVFAAILSIVCVLFPGSDGVYVYNGYPYVIGSLPVDQITINDNIFTGSPEHMKVYFPVQNGTYIPLIFISGLDGFLYIDMYSNVLTQLATHGYIVIGINLGYPVATASSSTERGKGDWYQITEEPARIYKAIEWLKQNLNQNVFKSEGHGNVNPMWTALGMFSHSSGASSVYKAIQGNTTLVKASVFLEPFIPSIKPLSFSLPILSYGTQLSEEPTKCIYPKYDYRVLYSAIQCPRIKMNATDFGHCDILDEEFWEVCHLTRFCKTIKTNDRVFYRTFIAGMMSSFFGAFLQENEAILQYVTEVDKIPLELGNFRTDLVCV